MPWGCLVSGLLCLVEACMEVLPWGLPWGESFSKAMWGYFLRSLSMQMSTVWPVLPQPSAPEHLKSSRFLGHTLKVWSRPEHLVQ